MVASLVYSVIRILVDVMVTSRSEEAELQAEVLALRRQVQVLERQIKRVRWSPADRMTLAALRERLPQRRSRSRGCGRSEWRSADSPRRTPGATG